MRALHWLKSGRLEDAQEESALERVGGNWTVELSRKGTPVVEYLMDFVSGSRSDVIAERA